MDNKELLNAANEYINSNFSINIFKKSGDLNTTQIYKGTPEELGVCIASSVEQLITNKIFSEQDILYLVRLGISKAKAKGGDI